MLEANKTCITVQSDSSLPIILDRLSKVCPELEGLTFTREIMLQGGKGQGGNGRQRLIFVHVSEDMVPLFQKILSNMGYLDQNPIQSRFDDGLSVVDIDDLIKLAITNEGDQSQFDFMISEPTSCADYIQ